jgi:hypothetical protein
MSVATGTAIALAVGASATAGAGIYAANRQAGSAHEAVTAQTDASNKAAQLQSQSAADQLAYTKQQAEQARLDADVTQHANYDQWRAGQVYQNATSAARTGAINALGSQYGVAARDSPVMAIPDYRSILTASGATAPGSTPAAGSGGAPAPGAATGQPAVSAAQGPIAPQVAAYFKARGVTPNPSSVDYWASKWNEFGARDPQYFNSRLAQADEFGGGAPAAAPATVGAAMQPPPAAAAPGTTPARTPPPNPALAVDPYQRRTVRDYFAA